MSRIVVGMTISTTRPSRHPIATVISDDDREGREAEVEKKLVRLLSRGLPVVSRDRDFDAGRNDAAADDLEPLQHVVGDRHRVRALALGDSERDRGAAPELAVRGARHRPGAMLGLSGADDDVGHVLDVDRAVRRASSSSRSPMSGTP